MTCVLTIESQRDQMWIKAKKYSQENCFPVTFLCFRTLESKSESKILYKTLRRVVLVLKFRLSEVF